MFAPHCPTCRRQILLGPRRIVAADLQRKPGRLLLRCFCGTIVHHLAGPSPARPTAAA